MNTGEVITVESSEFDTLLSAGVSILLVDDDSICLTILSKMLLKFGYKVITAKRGTDALSIAREREDELDLVLAETHLPDMDKYELLETMGEMSTFPVVIMSADDSENDMLGGLFKGAALYLVKPITMNDIKNLWQFAFMKKTDRTVAAEDSSCISSDHDTENQIFANTGRQSHQNGKRKEPKEMEEDNDDISVLKKPKLIWTNGLHNRFLQAIRVLGIDGKVFQGAHPKKILQHMNVPGLKKENISSHLQKYRLALKREQRIKKTMNRDYAQSHLASYNSSTVDIQGDLYQNPEMQSLTSFQPEFGSHEPENVSSCRSMPFLGYTNSLNHLGPNCNDSSSCKYGQLTLLGNQLDSTYPRSSFTGISVTSNGKLAEFRPMVDSNGEDFLKGNKVEESKQQQQQNLLPQNNGDEMFDMAKAPNHRFLDKEFNNVW
ncbi:two-component response regulator ARR14-like isoform X1 [Pistacia vera]|uniref:two-component response regulator ARR14-like isoform X1 n=1 Tax=Pistacia vera TaxID=55513 RepID=UPI001263CA15|nr:two-component response regulator ARR14-like isoform X1 [Pistacia vera]XP_031261403.1 two-component response regulator ARR14-like isoform X1 [Pistacia vera]